LGLNRPQPLVTLRSTEAKIWQERDMAETDSRTYKLIELVGVSSDSYAEATQNAVGRASQTLRGLGWFQVTELRGLIQDGEISEYQVTLKVGFRLMERDQL
jgi:dodecin